MKQYFIYTIIILFSLSIISNVYQWFNKPKPQIITNTLTKTKVDTIAVPKYYAVEKIKSKIDTIFINNEPQLIASADTIIKQNSDTIKVKYFFPPANYFNVNLSLKDKIIYHTDSIFVNTEKIIPAKTSWLDNFNFSIQAGFGQGLITKQFDFYYGIGISYDLKKIF